MKGVRQADDHRLNLRLVEQFAIVRKGRSLRKLTPCYLSTFRVRFCERNDVRLRRSAQSIEMDNSYISATNQTYSEGGHFAMAPPANSNHLKPGSRETPYRCLRKTTQL